MLEELCESLDLDSKKIEKLNELLPSFQRLTQRFDSHEYELNKMCKSVCKIANSVDDMISSAIKQIDLEVIQNFYNIFKEVNFKFRGTCLNLEDQNGPKLDETTEHDSQKHIAEPRAALDPDQYEL